MPVPSSSNYPTAVDNDTSLGGDVVNLTSVILSGSINSVVQTITTTATLSNVNTPCWLLIGSELIWAESKSGADFTNCNRGAGGTSAASHSDGATIKCVYAANSFNQHKRAIVATQTELGAAPKTITDNVTPAASPASVAEALDMFATAIKTLTGSGNWYSNLRPLFPSGHKYGCTLSNNGSDPTNDIDISVGEWVDSTNVENMILASALTKRLDATWAVGTNQGMRASGAAIADTTYHIFLIKRPDTGVVDVAADTSVSGANIAANTDAAYTKKRRIGSIVRKSGAILAFVQDNDLFQWKTIQQDIAALNPGISAVTRTMTVPTGIRVEGIFSAGWLTALAADNPAGILLSDLSVTDEAPNIMGPVLTLESFSGDTQFGVGNIRVMTNTSAQIRSRCLQSSANITLYISTRGYVDTRLT